MEARDSVLSAGQQAALDSKKVELAAADERYLREHPEVKAMVSAFTKHCLQSRPDSVREAAVAFFKDEASVRAAVAGSK
ncbi:hypothetical protein FNF27_06228 [Cafeteria roenbergensis]|uniref:RIIa domain-containing protein n=1 Tax=Cafeteria roenbergensis TaxID=33653 RepID=A0A5A8E779_CAFRO|nr:hypothetical protein FNF27_06228 [Cafeteria roenbergensis]